MGQTGGSATFRTAAALGWVTLVASTSAIALSARGLRCPLLRAPATAVIAGVGVAVAAAVSAVALTVAVQAYLVVVLRADSRAVRLLLCHQAVVLFVLGPVMAAAIAAAVASAGPTGVGAALLYGAGAVSALSTAVLIVGVVLVLRPARPDQRAVPTDGLGPLQADTAN